MKEAEDVILDYFNEVRNTKEPKEAWEDLLNGLLEQKEKQTIGSDHPLYNVIKEIALLNAKEKLKLFRGVFKRVYNEKDILVEPFSMRKLIFDMVKILFKKDDIKIFDPFSGTGGLLDLLAEQFTDADIFSQDINPNIANIQDKLFKLCDLNVKVNVGDSFKIEEQEEYDLIASNPPIGMRMNSGEINLEQYNELKYTKIRSEESFILKSLELVKEGGIIAGILPPGILFRRRMAEKVRDIILDKAQVLSIIKLSEGILLPHTAINPVIVILRKKVNKDYDPENLLVGSFEEIQLDSDEFKEERKKLLDEWEKFVHEEVEHGN